MEEKGIIQEIEVKLTKQNKLGRKCTCCNTNKNRLLWKTKTQRAKNNSTKLNMEFPVKGLSNIISPTSDLEDKAQEIYQNSEQKYMEMENTGKN